MAATVDFGGYLRSGSGTSTQGGTPTCFRLNQDSVFNTEGGSSNVDGAGRLGNECDTYGEIKLGTTMGDSEGTKFGVHTLIAYGTSQVTDYEGTVPAFREAYGDATGFGNGAFAKSTLWVGKRYYKREDVHILDLFTLMNTGPGAGIENIDLGFGKFSYALVRSGNQNYASTLSPGTNTTVVACAPAPAACANNPSAGLQIVVTSLTNPQNQEVARVTLNGDPSQQKTDHDFRLEGINLGSAGSLGLGVNIVRGNNAGANSANDYNGYSYWAKHSIVLFGAVQNGLMVQVAKDAANIDGSSLWWANSNSGNGTPGSMKHSAWRIIETANFEFDKVNGQAFLGYGKESFPWYGNGSNTDSDRTTTSLVVRPIYHFTENLGLAVELGTTRVSGYNLNYDNNTANTTNHLNKFVISPQLSMGSGFFARPVLRAYVSHYSWNKGGASACSGRDCSVSVPTTYDNVTSATTYGVQFEAWW